MNIDQYNYYLESKEKYEFAKSVSSMNIDLEGNKIRFTIFGNGGNYEMKDNLFMCQILQYLRNNKEVIMLNVKKQLDKDFLKIKLDTKETFEEILKELQNEKELENNK